MKLAEMFDIEEGLSANGAEGLGGHGEGFEQQNQGVTRRLPGEGPGVNGGRSQSQEMDSYDQPQYEAEDPVLDRQGWNVSHEIDAAQEGFEPCQMCWQSRMIPNPDGTGQTECPNCKGTGWQPLAQMQHEEAGWMGGKDAEGWDREVASGITNPGRDVTDEAPELRNMLLEPDSLDFTWNPGEHGASTDDIGRLLDKSSPEAQSLLAKLQQAGAHGEVSINQAELVELQRALRTAQVKGSGPDKALAKDVSKQLQQAAGIGESKETDAMRKSVAGMGKAVRHMGHTQSVLKKSSEKEKGEHPWMSDKQAAQVAKDHMRKGEGVKIESVFVFRKG